MTESIVIVGLGNPGTRYEKTRHNVGAMAVQHVAHKLGEKFKVHKKSGAQIAVGRLADTPVVLAVPTCFMNESGRQVGPLAAFYSAGPQFSGPHTLVVVHDELDIDFGAVRLKQGGGEGGHNGLRSISQAVGSKDYLRVRLGVGRPPGRQDPADFVLKPFSTSERTEVPLLLENASDAIELLISNTLEDAQNRVHAW
ncbi:aminoacyl-tRNA hydrolase [Williamsia sp. D3]|uniref:aminoacyl-tRNA hydrolase n=1 Tax=Williamsia sp. D3 TaxID=1313067 RepID=UPI0003D2C0E2|nr:aminoacyl-tRNA hydrolase [Williamsia sp. D3]ETD30404.1 peptidyl-tRNA hydrolase [Williamsia sp. D3]